MLKSPCKRKNECVSQVQAEQKRVVVTGDDGTTSKLQQKQAQMQQGKIEDIQPQQQQISTADYFSYDKEMSLTERRLLFKICQSKAAREFYYGRESRIKE
jgi:hypothetical protein